jgi:hypothetical protein
MPASPGTIQYRTEELRRVLKGRPSRRAVFLASDLRELIKDGDQRLGNGKRAVEKEPSLKTYLDELTTALTDARVLLNDFIEGYDPALAVALVFDAEEIGNGY